MAGTVKTLLDRIVELRSKGDPTLRYSTIAKLTLKGVNPARYTAMSPDDPAVVARVRAIAVELGVSL